MSWIEFIDADFLWFDVLNIFPSIRHNTQTNIYAVVAALTL